MEAEAQIHTFYIHGMRCRACSVTAAHKIKELPEVAWAEVHFESERVTVCGVFGDRTPEAIAELLSDPLVSHRYAIKLGKEKKPVAWQEFEVALPLALLFMVAFVALQKVGIVNMVTTSTVSYGTAFVVGIVASLSTCMAVVGGLVLSMSATFAKEGDRVRPQLLFHGGRLVSFFILGGIIGFIGTAFTLSRAVSVALNMLIALVMLVLGINLLEVFPWAKKIQLAMPRGIALRAHGLSALTHTLTPFLVGVATFFLPCGFTQSMQLYTLSTGSFLGGGLTMLSFALGTLPVLLLVGFSSFSVINSKKSGIFFKTAGLVVIMFALSNGINSLVVMGVMPPLFTF